MSNNFDVKLCVTGQHRQMLDQVLQFFGIKPTFDLNVMKPGQNLYSLTADIIVGMKVCHIEVGLGTGDKMALFPEEINRQLTTKIADYNFAPIKFSRQNLIDKNICETKIMVTGNTVIDALFYSLKKVNKKPSKHIQELFNQI